jgi:hypothetical protein
MPSPGGEIAAMKNIARLFFIGFLLFNFWGRDFIVGGCLNTVYAQEQGDWKQEYAEICAKTQNAMELSVAELKDRIERSDKLQERINKLEGPQAETEKKVFTKRLKMCRELYSFALEYKEYKE